MNYICMDATFEFYTNETKHNVIADESGLLWFLLSKK